MSSYEYTEVDAPPQLVVDALRAELRTRGIREYVVVDHGHDMAAAGATPHPAWTLIFGNPAAGEAVLAHELAAAVDIPLRLAVIGAGGETRQSVIVLRPVESLLGPELSEVAAKLTGVLRSLAAAARDAAQAA